MTAPNPMKGFRGVMAGALIIEAIVVALALLVVHRTGGGLASWKGLLVGGIVLGLIVTCGLLRYAWSMYVVLALQLAMLGSFFAVPELGVLGLIFGLVWTYLFWLRRDVAKRMAEGRLPSQQER
ncbi:DUF4233 domain-containing protein [Kibdelosporangium phytohabitans]|uniref:DUF4233 domain-containing protein n=1 Tax=Kibdelosporangium phytohabitans TaxID=860235 RepID=A0A0N9HRG9_9PSEU|nr:DUF4233 domain-containing protein [Kibdelosporangium phytohabitans]ALG07475.1 hypothetical protein AOZ06_11605 [Kibdelosporangium phytohabitans]MBE1471617.1 hypothetical protein [Kibdelosporangium phytohabitans]